MKKYLSALLILILFSGQALAYSVKIYNDNGYQIGTARKNGNDYIYYDLDGKEVTDFDAFYASPGDPNKHKVEIQDCLKLSPYSAYCFDPSSNSSHFIYSGVNVIRR